MSRLYKGKLLQLEKVRTLTGKKIEARSHAPVLTEVDGERPGVLPAALEIVPATLRLIIPQ
jgi:diacylglycerol kinase family enzyme